MAAALDADPESTVLLDDVLPNLVGTTTKEKRALIFGRVKALVQAAPAPAAAWAQRAMAERPDSIDVLRGFPGPALVIVGEEDALSSPTDAQAMVDALPNGQLVTIPEAGHLTSVEAPDQFNSAVREFLTKSGL
jgi:pimeloyl-ACP methyl ester carboxylesterase